MVQNIILVEIPLTPEPKVKKVSTTRGVYKIRLDDAFFYLKICQMVHTAEIISNDSALYEIVLHIKDDQYRIFTLGKGIMGNNAFLTLKLGE